MTKTTDSLILRSYNNEGYIIGLPFLRQGRENVVYFCREMLGEGVSSSLLNSQYQQLTQTYKRISNGMCFFIEHVDTF